MSLKPVRRIVTGHDAKGRAVIVSDSHLEGRPTPKGASELTLVWTTDTAPVDNDDPADGALREVALTLPGGSVMRTVDLLPGKSAPMHRTSSLDYGVLLSGLVELVLDDGAATLLEPGDIVVQRGTIHAWRNPSAEMTARIAFVLLDAKAAVVGGVALKDIAP